MPIATFATSTPRNNASLALPKISVAAPNNARIRLKTVNVFATKIDPYERLDRGLTPLPR